MTILVADACSLINFAAVDRMDLLHVGLGERARWTQAVEAEIRRISGRYPGLKRLLDEGWLGEPIELNRSSDITEVGRLRRALGGTSSNQLEHLGEAESIHALLSRSELRGAVLLTDDRDARHLATRRSLQVWDTTRLLADIHTSGELEWHEAKDVIDRMDAAERGVRVPLGYRDFA